MNTATAASARSEIIHHASGGTTLAGPDAVNLYRALTLASALSLYARTGMKMTRGAGPAQMLAMAKEYTGKAYKRTELLQASVDVKTWADTMKAALPITDNRRPEPDAAPVTLASLAGTTLTVTYHQDPGHGWIEVPRAVVDALGIAAKVSACSYQAGDLCFLEEDCDAALFVAAAKAAGLQVTPAERHTNGDSPIRRMAQFKA